MYCFGFTWQKGIEKWLGSVSQEIAAVAKIPVYISKDKQDNSKVLFTVDSSDISEDIVAKSFDMFDFWINKFIWRQFTKSLIIYF